MVNFIILAAGKGTRMKSKLPKVMHKIAGKAMIEIVYSLASSFMPKQIISVLSSENEDALKNVKTTVVIQKERLGTGHAVLEALPKLNAEGRTFILYGDTPLITKETLEKMQNEEAEVIVLGFKGSLEEKYGRLITKEGMLERIVEFKDLKDEEKTIDLFNSGVFLINSKILKELVPKISNQNNAGEFYLTDIIHLASEAGYSVKYILCEKNEVLGVNSREDLASVEEIMQNRLRLFHMQNGVTLIDRKSIFFSIDTEIAEDVILEQSIHFGGDVKIASNCVIKAFSYLEECTIQEGVSIGPFARIRGKTNIGKNSKIGNFVEIKNSTLDEGVKAGHLSYIGDGNIGSETNVGAGAVFCNYNGIKKYKTKIGKNVFIGSNTSLIAPIEVGDGAVLGAGSVISQQIPAFSLAIERNTQKIIPNYKRKI
jgi:bifunctional UDP-N-acetylglucosamine pyrophosphorylase/glucosamine-1-phosphate N-acetyltransferase